MNLPSKTTMTATILVIGLASLPALATEADLDNDGVPNVAEPLLFTDPLMADTDGDGVGDLEDQDPVFAENPIATAGPAAPFTIGEALVEDNFDYALNRDAPDHLELQILNPGATDLTGFSIYYTITDLDVGTTEGYFRSLEGFTVSAAGEARIHLDDAEADGHFRANPNSSYAVSEAAKLVTVMVSAEGFAPVTVEINKDAGGAEAAD